MKTTIISALFLVVNLGYSQSKQVTIIGNMPQQLGGEYISFSKPIGKFASPPFYSNSRDTAVIKRDKFIKKLDVLGQGLIYVYEKPFNGTISTRFFAEPGDTIVIERINGEIIFKGKNAIVNKMYSDIKIAHVAFNSDVYDILKNNTKSEEIIAKINAKEKEYYNVYNDLYRKKQISKACLLYTKMKMEHSIDGLVLNVAMDEQMREAAKIQIAKAEADKITDYFIARYSRYNKENIKSLFFIGLMKKSAQYLEQKALVNNKNVSKFWNQFDEIFKPKIKNIGIVDYLEFDDYKEMCVGQTFLDLIRAYDNEKTIKYKDLVLVYNAFTSKFPNSPYIIPLSDGIMKIATGIIENQSFQVATTSTKPSVSIGSLAVYDAALEPVGSTPFAQHNQSLVEALAEKFPNQDVFVDLWATWCGPCLMQFSYNKDLHAFLNTKNLKTIYVSFDKENDKEKWEKYIKEYDLKGYHFLGDKTYQEKFLNPLSEVIPRYFVFVSKTKQLVPVEGYPKEKELFFTNITNALETK
jgi:thiol-disulfide isomerase/thioredoxin